MKQLEVATLQVFQHWRSMEAQKIDHKSVPEFKPQNWEKKIAKADLTAAMRVVKGRVFVSYLSRF